MNSLARHFREIYQHRALVAHLVGRELKSRYRGSVLGFLWTFLNPLLLLSVYALVFSVYLRIEMPHYAAFMFTGLLAWIWAQTSLMDAAISVVAGGSLVTKVTFPLQILPLVRLLCSLANYILSLPILMAFLVIEGLTPTWTIAFLPLVVLAGGLNVWGLGLILASANVFFRDVQHILASLLTLVFFLTPILYPLDQVPASFRPLVRLNPLAGVMLAAQDIFFFRRPPDWTTLAGLILMGAAMLAVGALVFDRHKESFAEYI